MSAHAAHEFLDGLAIDRERADDRDCDCGVPPFEGAGQHANPCRCLKPYTLDERIEEVAERFPHGALEGDEELLRPAPDDYPPDVTLPDLQAHIRNLAEQP